MSFLCDNAYGNSEANQNAENTDRLDHESPD
jgi:hypothetical protein